MDKYEEVADSDEEQPVILDALNIVAKMQCMFFFFFFFFLSLVDYNLSVIVV